MIDVPISLVPFLVSPLSAAVLLPIFLFQRCGSVKSVLATFCLLFVAFWWACAVETPRLTRQLASHSVDASDDWRRTAAGWERQSYWKSDEPQGLLASESVAKLHPLVLAALQVLICCGALLWFDPPRVR